MGIFEDPLIRFWICLACVIVGGAVTVAIASDVNRGGDA